MIVFVLYLKKIFYLEMLELMATNFEKNTCIL